MLKTRLIYRGSGYLLAIPGRCDSRKMKVSILICLTIGVIVCGNSMSDETLPPIRFSSYHSDEPGCRANPATDLELVVNSEGGRWVIIAPRRVVATESERQRAGGPLDIAIAEPLESALRTRLANTRGARRIEGDQLDITRIKIVSVSHDVLGLGMGIAQAHLRLDFYICVNGDIPASSDVKMVARNGPDMSTLWHQPKGEELQAGFHVATDKALNAIVEYALRPPK
jgi:hypothetical protein